MNKSLIKISLSLILPVLILLMCSLAYGTDIKSSVDATLRYLRASQNDDGSYGNTGDKCKTTSLVLLAFGTSHRKYTTMDGPFVRRPAEWLIRRQKPNGSIPSESDNDPFDSTALAVAAVASVNRLEWPEQFEKACSFLVQQAKNKEPVLTFTRSGQFFNLLLALREYDPSCKFAFCAEYPLPLSLQDPDSIYQVPCRIYGIFIIGIVAIIQSHYGS